MIFGPGHQYDGAHLLHAYVSCGYINKTWMVPLEKCHIPYSSKNITKLSKAKTNHNLRKKNRQGESKHSYHITILYIPMDLINYLHSGMHYINIFQWLLKSRKTFSVVHLKTRLVQKVTIISTIHQK